MNTVQYVFCTCIGCICVHVFELQCIHTLGHTSLGQDVATERGRVCVSNTEWKTFC